MVILSTFGALLLVLFLGARLNWDGFNKPSNGWTCLAICVVSTLICMACFVPLWNLELHNQDSNSPQACFLGAVMMVCVYRNFKFGPQELPKKKQRV
jgi:hypothetical protein